MNEKKELPKGWVASTPIKDVGSPWVSLEHLLWEYSIPVLAEAAEHHLLQTIDSTGRRILATESGQHDQKSKLFALAHLEKRYAMESDPGPEDDLYFEMIEIQGSPLDFFGWPEDQLPNFDEIQPHFQDPYAQKAWTKRTLKDFENELKQAGSLKKAGELHGVSRQRYSQVISEKRKADKWGKI